MVYTFNVTYVNKTLHKEYHGMVNVELSDTETECITNCSDPSSDTPLYKQLQCGNKRIYLKIMEEAKPFAYYCDTLEARKNGLFEDICYEKVDMNALLEEDKIKGFYPYDQYGRKLSEDELNEEWCQWETEIIKDLTYRERLEYYDRRFKVYLGGYDDDLIISFDFPKQLIEACARKEHHRGIIGKIKNIIKH